MNIKEKKTTPKTIVIHLYMDRDTASPLLGETKRFKTQIRYIRLPLPLFLSSNKGVVI